MHRDSELREVSARLGADVFREGEAAKPKAEQSTNPTNATVGSVLDSSRAQSSVMQRVREIGSAIVNDLRVRPKNSFLDVSLVEEQAQPSSRIRSCSAPVSSSTSERSEGSSSSWNSAQRKMMDTSSGSDCSRPLVLRGPPAGRQDTDREGDEDVFTMSHDGGTCSNSANSDTDDTPDSDPSFVDPPPAVQPEVAEAPPSAPAGGEQINNVPQSSYRQLPSLGSVAHANGTCRPCTFERGPMGCRKGVNCNYCHLHHNSGPVPSKKTRPCKEKRLRQKKQMERVYDDFERDPDGFDVEDFDMPASLLNTSLEAELRDELRRRKANFQSDRVGTGASSSSSRVPFAYSSTRLSL